MLSKKNIVKMLGAGVLCLLLLGCEKESFLQLEEVSEEAKEISDVVSEEIMDVETSSEVSKETVEAERIVSMDSKESLETGESMAEASEKSLEANMEDFSPATSGKGFAAEEKQIVVHICGAVEQPGVYYLKESSRLHEGIREAGGFREDADRDYLNQAMLLEDGMKITVPTQEEMKQGGIQEISQTSGETTTGNAADMGKEADAYIQSSASAEEVAVQKGYLQKKEVEEKRDTTEQSKKVDLNTADQELLCTLPGIGESRAQSIIAYRKEHGFFQRIEDIMKISGIKEAAFAKIKDYITVSK